MKSTIMLNVAGPMFALSLLLLGVGILAASNVERQQKTNAELITREVNAMLAVEELYIVVRDIRHELNLYLRTHEDRHLSNISDLLVNARRPIELTKQLARTDTESDLIAIVDAGYVEFVKRFDGLLKNVPESDRDFELNQLSNTFLEHRIFEPIRKCMVHPGLLWVEAEATAVEEDGCFKVLTVSEATDSSLDGHDFAVHAFGNGVGDSVSAIAHDILQTLLD
jgi:hypothetical protein